MMQEDTVIWEGGLAVFLIASELQNLNKIAKWHGAKDLSCGLAQPSQKGKLRPTERKGLGQGPPH